MHKRVLFASANSLVQKVISKRLEIEGYQVSVASDGMEAERILLGESAIDVLVTEEFLPLKTGIELLNICTKHNIPAIIISDVDLESKILEAFEMGAYDFIDKPYSPNELVVRIKNIFKHYSR